jgi:hypothetical protein
MTTLAASARNHWRLWVTALLTVLATTLAVASPARATGAFGVESFATQLAGSEQGGFATQAGSHPYSLTTTIMFNSHQVGEEEFLPTGGSPKDIYVNLPVGLVVNPTATEAKCTEAGLEIVGGCPNSAAIGVVDVYGAVLGIQQKGSKNGEVLAPVYNLVPRPGVPAEFGFNVAGLGIVAHVVGQVRTGLDYGLSAQVQSIIQRGGVRGSKLTLWGNPTDVSHDAERGRCRNNAREAVETEAREIAEGKIAEGICAVPRTKKPLLTMPGSCTGSPLLTSMHADSWQEPQRMVEPAPAEAPAVTGCERLDFSPAISLQPDTATADSPSGLTVDLKVPQEEHFGGLAEANLKNAVVTLPPGMTVNPAQANGLAACAEDGDEGVALHSPAAAHCPDASKIGSVEVETPLLEHPLKGWVYLARQNANPFGSLLAIYVVAEGSGAVIKLAGHLELGEPGGSNGLQPGQLRTRFDDTPQLPFTDFKLNFFGGPRAPLLTPPSCGTFQTTSMLTPWSGNAAATLYDPLAITSGCASGFAPSFTAGTINNQAGGSSPLSVTFSRHDREQRLAGVTLHMPQGLLGKIAGIPLCGEAQATGGTCSPVSQIGTATSAVGAGPSPFYVPEAGQSANPVYLTGPYRGAPFGLSIVTHALAGPFDLGNVIVRAAISIDPHTAQITVTSDPLPTILKGIPLDIRTVNVTVDRPGFMSNPTNCEPVALTGTITSTEGGAAGVSSRFQAASCANLPFKPGFSATTTSSGNFHGASLDVKIAQKPGEAAIQKVDTQLPLALPSRLVTLQKACTEAQFAANPAGCPAPSNVGTATATTPVLNVPLSGPAYLVSHGGAAFPDLDIILQGEGVTIVLTGNTDIKKGITYSRFDTVPDAPISSFELNLPGGPGALLAATKNPCAPTKTVTVTKHVTRRTHGRVKHMTVKVKKGIAEPLLMPTSITGQNGAVVTQATKIAVTGCATKTSHKKPKANKRSKRRKTLGKKK